MKPIWRVTADGKNFVGTGRECDVCEVCGKIIKPGLHWGVSGGRYTHFECGIPKQTIFQKIAGWFK